MSNPEEAFHPFIFSDIDMLYIPKRTRGIYKDDVSPLNIMYSSEDIKREELSQFTPHEILRISSDEYKGWMNRMGIKYTLTDEELTALKMIYRKIRNRESAKRSRVAKKAYIKQLEEKIIELELEVKRLSSSE